MAERRTLNAVATGRLVSIASPGLETVSGPLVGAPRCWTTCASSWAIRWSPSDVSGLVLVLREVDVRAGRERARGDGVIEVVGGLSRCARGHPRGRRGDGESRSDTPPSSAWPLPRVESIVDWTAGWTSPVGMIPAPCERAMAPPNAWLPTLETNSLSGPAGSSAGSGLCSGARGFSCSWMRSGSAHTGEDTGGRARAQGPFGHPFGDVCSRRVMRVPPETSAERPSRRSSGPGCTSGRRRATSTIPPVPWRKLAIWAGVVALVLGVALAVMIPRINEGKETRAAPSSARRRRRPPPPTARA